MHLRNVSALRVPGLSGNALRGSIPSGFWSAPALLQVNLADNALAAPSGWTPPDPRRRSSGRSISPEKPVHPSDRPCHAFVPGDPQSLQFVSKAGVAHSSSPAPSVVRQKKHELIFS
ncbi:hypothetical protein C4D60_Mb05t14860 [Musa balbisiana]|uniref:Leucine-rich repeat-containing N-terminal plant-type domain-containing protein n=1 Tax=Musa balbisiana TaxID=52838 RepID=A0A4V6T4K6_MUSBA|nr:hypothetical protein C4D60_Mb05t14860 [Musa balbisiana]